MSKQSAIEPIPEKKWVKAQTANLWRYTPCGSYYARVKVLGKLKVKHLETKELAVARRVLPKVVAELRHQGKLQSAESAPKTFLEAKTIFLKRLDADESLKDRSKDYRRETIDHLEKAWPRLPEKRLAKISEDDCLDCSKRLGAMLGAQRYNNTIGTLKSILTIAVERGSIPDNPARQIQRKKVVKTEKELPTRAQFTKFLEEIRWVNGGAGRARYVWELVSFLAYSGCRVGEAQRVQHKHVDRNTGLIAVMGDAETGTKNWKTRRVPIIGPMSVLLDSIEEHREDPSPEDSLLKVKEAQKAMTRAAETVEMPRITHHNLRDLFATRCLESNVDVRTVAEWLGHSDGGALLLKTYAHLLNEHSLESAKKVKF